MELIRKNQNFSKETKTLKKENKNLDEMMKKLSSNMDFLMQENQKMKDLYLKEIERQKERIENLEKEKKTNFATSAKNSILSMGSVTTELDKLVKENNKLYRQNKIFRKYLDNADDLLLKDEDMMLEVSDFGESIKLEDPNFQGKTPNSKNENHKGKNHKGNNLTEKNKGKKLTEKERKKLEKEIDKLTGKKRRRGKSMRRTTIMNEEDEEALNRTTLRKLLPKKDARNRYSEYAGLDDQKAYCLLI